MGEAIRREPKYAGRSTAGASRHRPKQLTDGRAYLRRMLCKNNHAIDPVQVIVYGNTDCDQSLLPYDIRDLLAVHQHVGNDLLVRRARRIARILL